MDSVSPASPAIDDPDEEEPEAENGEAGDEQEPKTGKEKCVEKVKELKLEKNDDAEYTFTLVDKADNPLQSFVIRQFNEQLFIDKLSSALYGLCGAGALSKEDSSSVQALLAELTKQKLYEKMLEASLEVNDEQVLAGILKIFKHVNTKVKREIKDTIYTADSSKKSNSGKSTGFRKERKGLFIAANGSDAQRHPDAIEYVNDPLFNPADTVPAGRLQLKQKIVTRDTTVDAILIIHDIEIQFQDGFIENLKVIGNFKGQRQLLKFENAFPIAFSTRKDFRKIYDIVIYERTIYAKNNGSRCHFKLGDLLFYSQNLQLNTKDYSPVNHVLKMKVTKKITTVNLYKENTSKILELKVFSDLKGIDNDNPNGLVQLEFSKKLNFLTMRFKALNNAMNVGFFNHFTPGFAMNKIENNNKRLVLSYFGTNRVDTFSANVFAPTIKLLQHQVFTVGGNMNVMTFDIPGLKSTFCVNAGIYWGRVLFEDTLRSKVDSSRFERVEENNVLQFGLNSIQFVPEIVWQIFPDKRYGVVMSQKFDLYRLQSGRVRQVRDSVQYVDYLKSLNGDRSRIDNYSFGRWLGTTEIYAFFIPSDNNRIFFRYRFNWDLDNIRQNFHQVQIGISTFLTHTKKTKSKGSSDSEADK
jgi:hypothetical protein